MPVSPLAPLRPFTIPKVQPPAGQDIMTLDKARELLRTPDAPVPASTLATAKRLFGGVPTFLPSLDPRTGQPEKTVLLSQVFHIVIAPGQGLYHLRGTTKYLLAAFRGARRELPDLFVVPSVGRWPYVHFPASHAGTLRLIDGHLKTEFPYLCVSVSPLPEAILALDAFAAGDFKTALLNECRRLRRAVTELLSRPDSCAADPRVLRAFEVALEGHFKALSANHSKRPPRRNLSRCTEPSTAPQTKPTLDLTPAEAHQRDPASPRPAPPVYPTARRAPAAPKSPIHAAAPVRTSSAFPPGPSRTPRTKRISASTPPRRPRSPAAPPTRRHLTPTCGTWDHHRPQPSVNVLHAVKALPGHFS
eukprot:GFKZ01000786.1.p1 GENE.GFKZ01000786.1~~GFKZ01000786.1.p1  ORF type:complete len:379 (+),score=16.02 GFKZ01000786.1:57-1139(+)